MLKTGLQLSLGQQLAMTPQLQQAIKLLQLSAQDLELEIHNALEANIMLQAQQDPAWGDSGTPATTQDSVSKESSEPSSDATAANNTAEATHDVADSHTDEFTPQAAASASKKPLSSDMTPQEPAFVDANPLHSHLVWQIEMGSLSDRDVAIALALIDALDDDGYLTDPLSAVCQWLAPDLDVDVDEVEAVLHYVQMLDPVGVGARNLNECLHLQLRHYRHETPVIALARTLVDEHLDIVAQNQIDNAVKQLNADAVHCEQAIAIVKSLEPRPGRAYAAPKTDYIVPDVIVNRCDGEWQVRANSALAPRLGINDYYASLLKRGGHLQGNTMLKDNLREARWLIHSLDMRHQTLVKVATALVHHQQAYLDGGEEAMQPLILRDIAEEIDMHESTVSRVTTNKYMQTPHGVVSFKHFFSNHLTTQNGGRRSVTAIRALIKKMIDGEDNAKPLSDGAIAERLHTQDIQVARRTIAKYREALGIASKSERRKRYLSAQQGLVIG